MISGGRNNQAKRKGSIVFGHDCQAKHNNALIANITIKGMCCVVGGGQSSTASRTSTVIGDGLNNLAQGQDGFLGGGEKNQLKGQLEALGGGKFNIVMRSSVGSCIGGRFKNIVKGPGNMSAVVRRRTSPKIKEVMPPYLVVSTTQLTAITLL